MSKTNKNTMDMTHGTLWNKILIFALPLAASSILQQLFNSIDTAVVGRFASSQALAAVGSNSSLIALMINLFIGISLGSNVVIAHYIGQRSEKNIQAAIHTAIVVALVSGIFVMIAGACLKAFRQAPFSGHRRPSHALPDGHRHGRRAGRGCTRRCRWPRRRRARSRWDGCASRS